jgi:DNA-binding transcriptional regulator YdaS (Cro superfamily)
MNIPDYLKKKRLSQGAFARLLGCSPGLVWQWINGRTTITAERAITIERKTRKAITRHDLRPDLYQRQA